MEEGPSTQKRQKTLAKKLTIRGRRNTNPEPERSPSPDPYLPEHWEVDFVDQNQVDRYNTLLERQFISQKFAHPKSLQELFLYESVQTLFSNLGWAGILDIHAPSYLRPSLEILSSLHFTDDILSFRLNNRLYRIHTDQICALVGQDPTDTVDIYKVKLDQSYVPTKFWKIITDLKSYSASTAKASSTIHPALRVAHRILATIVFPREERSTISSLELRLLWHMVKEKDVKPHFGKCIGHRLLSNACALNGQVHYAGLLTLILQSPALGLAFHPDEPIMSGGHFLTTSFFESMKMCRRSTRGSFIWILPKQAIEKEIWVTARNAHVLQLDEATLSTDWLLEEYFRYPADRDAPHSPYVSRSPRGGASSSATPSSPHIEDDPSSVNDQLSRIEENLSGLRTDFQSLNTNYQTLNTNYQSIDSRLNTFHKKYTTNWGQQQI